MANYIGSNANRFYVALESSYGTAASIGYQNRFAANRVSTHHTTESLRRLDKTGTRTYAGQSPLARRRVAYELRSYLNQWNGADASGQAPLFQAALGGAVEPFQGGIVGSSLNSVQIQSQAPHGLSVGSAVSIGGEIRFVTAVPDGSTVLINAPFTRTPQPNDRLNPTLTYRLGATLPSLTIYDFWDPISAVSRVLVGAAVDRMEIRVNGDYQEFYFTGPAADILDSTSGVYGSSGLTSFPIEPALATFDSSGVPGHLGQIWLGNPMAQCFTLTEARIEILNGLELRNREFGASVPRAVVPGPRQVGASFSLLAQDDDQTKSLYAASKQRQPLAMLLQLGLQQGRLMGIYLPTVIPEVPSFDDSEIRLQWKFDSSLAQGTSDDELVIAFA